MQKDSGLSRTFLHFQTCFMGNGAESGETDGFEIKTQVYGLGLHYPETLPKSSPLSEPHFSIANSSKECVSSVCKGLTGRAQWDHYVKDICELQMLYKHTQYYFKVADLGMGLRPHTCTRSKENPGVLRGDPRCPKR